jgi:hypothetical protein
MLLKLVKTGLLSLVLSSVFMVGLISSNKALANQATFKQPLCDLAFDFSDKPKTKQQTLKLNDTVTMVFTNAVALKDGLAARIASNVTHSPLTFCFPRTF